MKIDSEIIKMKAPDDKNVFNYQNGAILTKFMFSTLPWYPSINANVSLNDYKSYHLQVWIQTLEWFSYWH